jgi:hypothetical protein
MWWKEIALNIVSMGSVIIDLVRTGNGSNSAYNKLFNVVGGLAGGIWGLGVLGLLASGPIGGALALSAFFIGYGLGYAVSDWIFDTGIPDNHNSQTAGGGAEAATPPIPRDPLVIDLDRDGKTDTSGFRFFDMDANGRAELSSWVSGGDGLLVIDKNDNGIIDDGLEVFGNQYVKSDGSVATDPFDALSDFDSNSDGVIDSNDVNFADLKVWADLNADGVFDNDELVSLEDAGIESISLENTSSGEADESGNTVVAEGQITWSDGDTGIINAYEFWSSDSMTLDPEGTVIPADIQELPNLYGRGTLNSLHLAMTLDESGELKELVEDFSASDLPEDREVLFDQILFAWAGASDIDPSSRGGFLTLANSLFWRNTEAVIS